MSPFDIYSIISTHLAHEVILVAIQKTIEHMRCSFVGDPTKSDGLASSDTAALIFKFKTFKGASELCIGTHFCEQLFTFK